MKLSEAKEFLEKNGGQFSNLPVHIFLGDGVDYSLSMFGMTSGSLVKITGSYLHSKITEYLFKNPDKDFEWDGHKIAWIKFREKYLMLYVDEE